MAESLTSAENSGNQYYMAGFLLRNTLSEYGSVSRAIGKVNKKMFLEKMTEYARIEKRGSQIVSFDAQGREQKFTGDEIVSMNFWGFRPSIFGFLQTQFADFLRVHAGAPKSQFFIPAAVDRLIRSGKALVKVLTTTGSWFGVTYRQGKGPGDHSQACQ